MNRIQEDVGLIPGLTQGVKNLVWPLLLWCRWQTWLGSRVAVVVTEAGSCSSNLSPSWELPYATGMALKRKKKKEVVLGSWFFKESFH